MDAFNPFFPLFIESLLFMIRACFLLAGQVLSENVTSNIFPQPAVGTLPGKVLLDILFCNKHLTQTSFFSDIIKFSWHNCFYRPKKNLTAAWQVRSCVHLNDSWLTLCFCTLAPLALRPRFSASLPFHFKLSNYLTYFILDQAAGYVNIFLLFYLFGLFVRCHER